MGDGAQGAGAVLLRGPESELLALALALTCTAGRLRERWWWRALGVSTLQEPARALARRWVESAGAVPAALELLARRREAAAAVAALGGEGAAEVLAAVVRVFALPPLDLPAGGRAGTAAGGAVRSRAAACRAAPAAGRRACVTALARGRARGVRRAARCAGVGTRAARARARAPPRAGARALRAVGRGAGGGPRRAAGRVAHGGCDGDEAGAVPRGAPSGAPSGVPGDAAAGPAGAFAPGVRAAGRGGETPRGRHDGLFAIPQADTPPAAVVVHTELGGVLFLANVLLALGVYGDFASPRRPGVELDFWLCLRLLAARLLAPRPQLRDPLWPLLRDLAADEPSASARLRSGARGRRRSTPADVPGWRASPVEAASTRGSRGSRSACAPIFARPASSPPALLRRAARVELSATRVDVDFDLAGHPIEIRMAGLDRDPGWIPAAGRSLAFRFA